MNLRAIKMLFLLLVLFSGKSFSQEADISPALKQIESGNTAGASKILLDLKANNAGDPSVIFLDALLTKEGDEALRKYSIIIEKYPESKYADAALYRIFSYYYSLGFYKKAETYLDRLKKDFPESAYLKTADQKLPDVEEPVGQATDKPETPSVAQQEKTETKIYNFTIQAGAFLNSENARKLSEQLNKENYSTEISSKEVGGTILNVVTVGKFVDEEEAKPVLSLLDKKFNIKGRIVPIIKIEHE